LGAAPRRGPPRGALRPREPGLAGLSRQGPGSRREGGVEKGLAEKSRA
jgi:hypothetical protein